jgi:cold shock CspA family protein
MPTGRVKFYDADRGFGYLVKDSGGDLRAINVVPM